jgi:hypoxanthine phosphoribosyltransferase
MEKFEDGPKIEQNFHFKEIAEIEPAMVSLISQLKEKIENGEYDTLISDDVGGRIPTIILRKIIEKLNPDKNIETYFIASGKNYLPFSWEKNDDYEKLREHLKKITKKTKKALVVTQFIFTGKTLIRLADALKDVGLDNFDIAAVDAMPHFEKENFLRRKIGENNLYIGGEEWNNLHEEHEKFGGVRKPKKYYSPFPRRMADIIAQEGRELSHEEWQEIFGIEKGDSSRTIRQKSEDPERNAEFDKRTNAPLTQEEKEEIQKNINLTREDVTLLADRVVEQVWGQK